MREENEETELRVRGVTLMITCCCLSGGFVYEED
jgi:hypothetical protein